MAQTKVQDRNCPHCGATASHTIAEYSHPEWPIAQCDSCEFVYLKRVPADEAFVEDYAWEKTHAQEARRRKASSLLYRLDYATRFRLKLGNTLDRYFILRSVGDGGKVLDVGCGGSCRIVDGLIPYGIEISKGLASISDPIYRARGGHVVNDSAVSGLDSFDDNFFDHAILRSYLEHETQPRPVLEKLFKKLTPGGTAAVKVPDYGCIGRRIMGAKWCGFRFPDHQNYYTRTSLRRLSESIGFECRFSNVVPGLNDNLYAVLTKPREVSQAATILKVSALTV